MANTKPIIELDKKYHIEETIRVEVQAEARKECFRLQHVKYVETFRTNTNRLLAVLITDKGSIDKKVVG